MRHTCWSSPPTLRPTWPWTVAWPGSCSPTTGNATWTPRTCTACPPPWWVCSQSVWRGLHKGDREGCCFFPCITFSKSIYYKLIINITYKCTALVNFYKNRTKHSTYVNKTFSSTNYCSLDILSFYDHSLGTVEMVVCENASRSEVSKILRPTRLAPTTSISFLPHPGAGLELQKIVFTTFVCMPKCIQLLHLMDWLAICFNKQLNMCT